MGHMKNFDLRIRQGGDDAIAAVSELLAGRWVPVSERLPDGVEEVLVYWIPRDKDGTPSCAGCDGRGGLISMAWYERLPEGDGAHWNTNCDGIEDPLIPLFWMPLPEPPQAK